MVTKGYFSRYAFLNVWKHLLSAGDSFAGVWSILCHAFPKTQDFFSIFFYKWRPDFSSANFRETSSVSCLLRMGRALLRANLHISVFRACATRPKVDSVGYSWKKIGKTAFVVSWMTESRTFARLFKFHECSIDFHDFQEQIQYSHNGRHVGQPKKVNYVP